MKRFINSERIYLRAFTLEDLNLLHCLNSDPEVMEFIKKPESLEESEESLKRCISYYEGNGLGIWAMHLIDTDEFIGLFIFRPYENSEDIELGYRLHKKFWGKGYASEMTNTIIDYAFDVLEIPELFAVTMPGNINSEKVLKKCGFRKAGTTEKYYNAKLNLHIIKQ